MQACLYDSDSSSLDTPREKPSVPVKESPFRISKSSRKSRSPAVSSTGRARLSSRQTPKVRLRHNDSQVQFESIISSPTNPFNQESQILTERQKETYERQTITAGIFSRVGSNAGSRPTEMSPTRPQEAQRDSVDGDDLPNANSRTPLKTLAAMGPMDVYLGSSPTPQARNRSQQVLSDETSVATPIPARRLQLLGGPDELGSSPLQLEKQTAIEHGVSNNALSDSFTYRQPDGSYSISFDEGTTVDEELLPDADEPVQADGMDHLEDEIPTELDSVEVPSSAVEDQLNAQLDADLAGRNNASVVEEGPMSDMTEVMDTETEVQTGGEQPDLTGTFDGGHDAVPSSATSLVGDSFVDSTAGETSPGDSGSAVGRIRRSSRRSLPSSPREQPVRRKRKQSLVSNDHESQDATKEEVQAQDAAQPKLSEQDDDSSDMIDCIVLAPASKTSPKKKNKRRSRSKSSQNPSTSQSIVPETTRKVDVHRSASSLSQVETHEDDVLVEDTPAPKRSRKSANQDVSEAKGNTAQDSQPSQLKRLSHVQVSPRHHSSQGSPKAIKEDSMGINSPATSGKLKAKAVSHPRGDTAASRDTEGSQLQQASAESETPNRSFAERVILTPRSILGRIRRMISDCSQMVLGREEEREIDDAMFDLRRAVHSAGRRGQEGQ